MSFEIVSLKEEHLQGAAALLASQHLADREREPALPSIDDIALRVAEVLAKRGLPASDETAGLLPLLRLSTRRGPGVAAFRDGQLVGYLRTSGLELTTRLRTASTGMQNLAVDPADGAQTYREMYAAVAPQWLAKRCFFHFVKLLARDKQAIDAWFSLGFGQVSVQVFRDTNYTHEKATGIEVVPAQEDHIELLVHLQSEHRHYSAEAPMFIPAESGASDSIDARREEMTRLIRDPDRRCWVALRNGSAAGMMSLGPWLGSGLSPLLDLNRMVFVQDALTGEAARDPNVRGVLLDAALNWARGQGYERCYAAFRAADTLAHRFWFGVGVQPIAYWLMRRIDERIARAGKLST